MTSAVDREADHCQCHYQDQHQCAPGGLLDVAAVRPTTVPIATPAPIIAPVRSTRVRVRCCLAGAMATPAGCDAAIPLTLEPSAAAVPTGLSLDDGRD